MATRGGSGYSSERERGETSKVDPTFAPLRNLLALRNSTMPSWGRIPTALAKPVSVSASNIRSQHSPLALSLQTNRLARLAPGSAVLSTGSTTILATVTHGLTHADGKGNSITPLLVDFRSKAAAVGIIPATWSRREQQPALYETATARLIDRSLRPSLKNASSNSPTIPPTHISVSILSAERTADAPLDALAVNAASAALSIAPEINTSSDTPLTTAARVAVIKPSTPSPGDELHYITFPSDAQIQEASLSLFAAVNKKGNVVAMSVTSKSEPSPENEITRALNTAVQAALALQPTIREFQDQVKLLRDREGNSSFPPKSPSFSLSKTSKQQHATNDEERNEALERVFSMSLGAYDKAFVECRSFPGKAHRASVMTRVQSELINKFVTDVPSEDPETRTALSMEDVLDQLSKASHEAHRKALVRDNLRIDGRKFDEVRPIRCETSVLPGDVHGSALFERGDTQVLACSTFGHKHQLRRTEEYLDGSRTDSSSSTEGFFVHYSFPSFATGEYGRFGQSQNRREVGHSLLTEKAIAPLLGDGTGLDDESFPYALRVSTDVLSSDGSSSMASVCAGSMAIMDAGAPLRKPVAGIAMGLITAPDGRAENDVILTDILGAEDHFGDMDMKVAGTADGVTACQLDVKKADGVSVETISRVLERALEGRIKILNEMARCGLTQPREMARSAPRTVRVPVNRERAKNTLFRDRFKGLRAIGAQSDSYLTANDKGDEIVVESPNKESAEKAEDMIRDAVKEIRVGDVMDVKVTEVRKTFAKVEAISGSASGLLHASKISIIQSSEEGSSSIENKVSSYSDIRRLLHVGDEISVKVIECDEFGTMLRFKLLKQPADHEKRLGAEIDSILEAMRS